MSRNLNKTKYRIQSARLRNWDYSSNGMYYVTICSKDRVNCFGAMIDGKMILSDMGKIAGQYWTEIPGHFPFARVDAYVIMPNHVHGIIAIEGGEAIDCRDANNRVSTNLGTESNLDPESGPETNSNAGGITRNQNPMLHPHSLARIMRWYKGRVSFEINKSRKEIPFAWQSRFYDHIVRNDADLNRIREYINLNPINWEMDENNIRIT